MDRQATTAQGTTGTLRQAAIGEFAGKLRGGLLLPDHDGFARDSVAGCWWWFAAESVHI